MTHTRYSRQRKGIRTSFGPTAAVMRDIITAIAVHDTDAAIKNSFRRLQRQSHATSRHPLADGNLAMHFGHCAQFALMDIDLIQCHCCPQ